MLTETLILDFFRNDFEYDTDDTLWSHQCKIQLRKYQSSSQPMIKHYEFTITNLNDYGGFELTKMLHPYRKNALLSLGANCYPNIYKKDSY